MQAYAGGEVAAFETLVMRHRMGLYNFLLRSTHDKGRAEELLQEVFIRVVRARDRYVITAKFSTWVYTIARNLAVDESRRAVHRKTVSLDAPAQPHRQTQALAETVADQVPGVDSLADGPRLQRRIGDAIAQLPEDQREVFLLRQVSGLSFREIADVVQVSENTVKSRMRYALEKIRQELADLDPREDGDAP